MTSKNLKQYYLDKVRLELSNLYNIQNPFNIPILEKVVINRGIGEAIKNNKIINDTVNQFIAITGQKPILTTSKKSIANFQLRQGQVVGCKVTLRAQNMYDFISKLFNVVLPKIRDFRGVSLNSFDRRGNYTLALKEDSIFPEITGDVDKSRGFDITFVTNAQTSDDQCYKLLALLGMPFRNK